MNTDEYIEFGAWRVRAISQVKIFARSRVPLPSIASGERSLSYPLVMYPYTIYGITYNIGVYIYKWIWMYKNSHSVAVVCILFDFCSVHNDRVLCRQVPYARSRPISYDFWHTARKTFPVLFGSYNIYTRYEFCAGGKQYRRTITICQNTDTMYISMTVECSI